jgi:hypothetical protein
VRFSVKQSEKTSESLMKDVRRGVAYRNKMKIETNILGKRVRITHNMSRVIVLGPDLHARCAP